MSWTPLALSWKEYTRYNGMSLAEVHSEHSAGSAGASANGSRACPHGPPRVPGLALILDAITAREEEALVEHINEYGRGERENSDGAGGWSTCARKVARERPGFRIEDHRRVMHFGHAFDYDTRGIGESKQGARCQLFCRR